MSKYNLFFKNIEKMSVLKQKKLISSIFEKEVLTFSIDDFDEKIIIKFYDGNTYYQIVFIFDVDNNDYFNLKIQDRIVTCDVFVDNIPVHENKNTNNNFYKFIKILKDCDTNLLNSFFEDDF